MSLLQKWVAALRSGKYQQVRYYLRTPCGYCVEGVLCDVSGMGTWREHVTANGHTNGYRWVGPDGETKAIYLHPQILAALREERVVTDVPLEWLTPKMQERAATNIFVRDGRVSLQGLNDYGLNFQELADLLERANPHLSILEDA